MLLVFSTEDKTAIILWASGCLLFLKINSETAAYKTTFPKIFPFQIFNINSLHVDDILVLDVYHLEYYLRQVKLWVEKMYTLLPIWTEYICKHCPERRVLFLGQGPFCTLLAKVKLDLASQRGLTSSQVKRESLADVFGIFQVDATALLDQRRGWLHGRFPSVYAASKSWAPRSGLTKHQPINFIRKQSE